MRVLLAAAVILMAAVPSAQASYHYRHKHHYAQHKHHVKHWRHWTRHVKRHYRRIVRRQHHNRVVEDSRRDNVAVDCMGTARRQGGPCGCFAEHGFFETTSRLWRGWNLWLADEWRRAFPITEPAAGTAAVWPGRHVAKVLAVDGARVKVHDSWAVHWVSKRGLVFVQPPGKKRDLVRYAAAPL